MLTMLAIFQTILWFFFAECASVTVPLLMYEDTQACLCQVFEEPLKLLERKVNEADAFLLVTDKTGFEIPPSLATVKHHFTGNNFTWRPYGVQCVLLGGSVHSRRVAMRLRVFLEGSDYPYMAGVLPQRCSWTEMYAVDPSLETPGPCVLWKRQHNTVVNICFGLHRLCWLLHKPKLKLAEANFQKFCRIVSYKVRCLPRSCYK